VKLKIYWHGNNYVGKSSEGRYTKERKQGYLVTDARRALVGGYSRMKKALS
jgi:hypothetical protein